VRIRLESNKFACSEHTPSSSLPLLVADHSSFYGLLYPLAVAPQPENAERIRKSDVDRGLGAFQDDRSRRTLGDDAAKLGEARQRRQQISHIDWHLVDPSEAPRYPQAATRTNSQA